MAINRTTFPHDASYVKAYEDLNLLKHDVMRPIRMELEVLKPELYLKYFDIEETIVCFGSARIYEAKQAKKRIEKLEAEVAKNPEDQTLKNKLKEAKGLATLSKYYDTAREFAKIVADYAGDKYAVVTGGGPGIMEAANRGAFENGGKSVGLNITLPHEQRPNPYICKNMSFLFHYFAIRKIHFVMRAKAFVVFPGGFGTFDELFEILTLIQTGKKKRIPVVLVGKEFWSKVINVEALANYWVISHEDKKFCPMVETAKEAWAEIEKFYQEKKEEK